MASEQFATTKDFVFGANGSYGAQPWQKPFFRGF
jgi:hypothetical protein